MLCFKFDEFVAMIFIPVYW